MTEKIKLLSPEEELAFVSGEFLHAFDVLEQRGEFLKPGSPTKQEYIDRNKMADLADVIKLNNPSLSYELALKKAIKMTQDKKEIEEFLKEAK